MKKLTTFTIIFLFIACFFANSQQILLPYKAKEGLQTAQNSANNSGIPNMQLFIIVTITGKIPNYDVSIEFDINTGKSNVWIYVFRSSLEQYKDSTRAYVVVRLPLIGFMTVTELPGANILSMLPIVPDSPLPNQTWIDSDIMSEKIRQNETFIELKNQLKDLGNAMVGLGVNNTPTFEPNTPYWAVSFTSEGGFINCFVNAKSGETECFGTVLDVEWDKLSKEELYVFPNPASDIAFIKLPEVETTLSVLNIYDINGNLINSYDPKTFGNNTNILLPTNNLSQGHYFIELVTAKKSYKTNFIIEK